MPIEIFDSLVLRLIEQDSSALVVVVANAAELNRRCALGFAPLYATCYGIWVEGTAALIEAGAGTEDVGLGCSAASAVALGFKDLASERKRYNARAARMTIEMLLMRVEARRLAPRLMRRTTLMLLKAA